MTEKVVTASISGGTEARPVAVLVQLASEYKSHIMLECGTRRVNAKSIMGLMALGLHSGCSVKIEAEGVDEQMAVEKIGSYLSGRTPASV